MKLGVDAVVNVGDADICGDAEFFQAIHARVFHQKFTQTVEFEQSPAVADCQRCEIGEFFFSEQGYDFVERHTG